MKFKIILAFVGMVVFLAGCADNVAGDKVIPEIINTEDAGNWDLGEPTSVVVNGFQFDIACIDTEQITKYTGFSEVFHLDSEEYSDWLWELDDSEMYYGLQNDGSSVVFSYSDEGSGIPVHLYKNLQVGDTVEHALELIPNLQVVPDLDISSQDSYVSGFCTVDIDATTLELYYKDDAIVSFCVKCSRHKEAD